MKSINFEGVDYLYKITHSYSDRYSSSITHFYRGIETVPKWQFLFWKSKKMVIRPKKVFKIDENIESEYVTKDRIRNLIAAQVNLLHRREEIEKGEII